MSSLSAHRIVAIEPASVRSVVARNIGRNALRDNHGDGRDLAVVMLRTDKGAHGWGHAGTGGVATLAGLENVDRLIGRTVAELIDPDRGVIHPSARVLDVPLHDLAGRILDLPVYAMLGGRGSRDVRCYSGGIYLDDLDPESAPAGLDAIRRNMQMDWVLGHRDFKLKIGRGHRWMPPAAGLDRDIAVTRLARELYPEARLMVDANDGYTLEETERYLSATGDCDLYWLEELFPEGQREFSWLRQRVVEHCQGTLIADGETQPDTDALVGLARSDLLDVALMDAFRYGITAWRDVMPALEAAGTSASPHTWGSPLTMYYAAHLAAGLGNVDIIEAMPAVVRGADTRGYTFGDGVLSVSDAPGFGLQFER